MRGRLQNGIIISLLQIAALLKACGDLQILVRTWLRSLRARIFYFRLVYGDTQGHRSDQRK